MVIIEDVRYTPVGVCSYLPHEAMRYAFFYAHCLTHDELEQLLVKGWRKFGQMFFRMACPSCRKCIPIRVPVKVFQPTRSQRRVIRKNADARVEFKPLAFSQRIYEIYQNHSTRFQNEISDVKTFIDHFVIRSSPSFQSEYYHGQTLMAVGYLDHSSHALSSVYFIFDTQFSRLSPGTFSVLREIEHARDLGLDYYYLGYYNPDCQKIAYKNNFRPCEVMNWDTFEWHACP